MIIFQLKTKKGIKTRGEIWRVGTQSVDVKYFVDGEEITKQILKRDIKLIHNRYRNFIFFFFKVVLLIFFVCFLHDVISNFNNPNNFVECKSGNIFSRSFWSPNCTRSATAWKVKNFFIRILVLFLGLSKR